MVWIIGSRLVKFIPDLSRNNLGTLLHPILIALWIGMFSVLRMAIRRYHDRRWKISKLLNLVTALLLIWPTFQILCHEWNLSEGTFVNSQASSSGDLTELAPALNSLPDIYYIILDGYAREDTLNLIYDYDNDPFLAFLRDLGFHIVEASTSNYAQTVLSITSSLNMDYLDSLSRELDPDPRNVSWLMPLIRQSRVREFLELKGYQIVAFESGYEATGLPDADLYLQAPTQAISNFESLWIRTTALLLLEDASSSLGLPYPYSGYQAHTIQIEFIF